MSFFSIEKYAIKKLILNMKWKEFIGKYPYNHYCTEDGKINYYDWWYGNANQEWFTRFLRFNFPEMKSTVNFYSVFGKNRFIYNPIEGKKIFYTAENIKRDAYCLDVADLSLGFEEFPNSDNYFHLPGWFLYLIPPEATEPEIKQMLNSFTGLNEVERQCDAVLIARHDTRGTRRMIADEVGVVLDIKYPGKWRNNTNELWDKYHDDKIRYMRNFKFNICPENSNADNYVTEKIFQAIVAGTIPIYYGANNNPEKDIINPQAVVFWNKNNNKENLELIKLLRDNKNAYREFIEQPRLLPSAGDCIIDKMNGLKQKFKEFLE